MTVCQHCGNSNPPKARFCFKCGAKLQATPASGRIDPAALFTFSSTQDSADDTPDRRPALDVADEENPQAPEPQAPTLTETDRHDDHRPSRRSEGAQEGQEDDGDRAAASDPAQAHETTETPGSSTESDAPAESATPAEAAETAEAAPGSVMERIPFDMARGATSDQPNPVLVADESIEMKAAAGKGHSRALRITIIAVVAVIVVVATAVVGRGFANRADDPTPMVERYIQALQDGDYSKAASMERGDLTDAQKTLLSAPAQDSAYAMSQITMASAGADGDTRSYDVSYSFAGKTQKSTIVVTKDANGAWRFTSSLMSALYVTVPSGLADGVTVNGLDLAAGNATGSADASSSLCRSSCDVFRFAVYPGRYAVSVDSDTAFFTLGVAADSDDDITIASSATNEYNNAAIYDAQPTADLKSKITSQLATAYRSCISSANAGEEPEGACGVYWSDLHSDAQYSNWRYTQTSAPSLDGDYDGITLTDPQDGADISGTFSANAAYTYEYDFTWSNGTVDHEVSAGTSALTGTFSITDGTVTVSLGK